MGTNVLGLQNPSLSKHISINCLLHCRRSSVTQECSHHRVFDGFTAPPTGLTRSTCQGRGKNGGKKGKGKGKDKNTSTAGTPGPADPTNPPDPVVPTQPLDKAKALQKTVFLSNRIGLKKQFGERVSKFCFSILGPSVVRKVTTTHN